MNQVYFDNAATTKLREEVIEEMHQLMRTHFGNASSTHAFGREVKSILETCRKQIANLIGAKSSEIIFTSGGTESDNLVLQRSITDLGVSHIITSKIEHHAVLHTVERLVEEGKCTAEYVTVLPNGQIDYNHLETLLAKTNEKCLVSLMHINNEIGCINNIEQIGTICRKHEAYFHTDAVQSVGHFSLNLNEMPLDFLAASAHKFHGPKGVGFAYINKSNALKSLIVGGEQERGCRAGTEAIHNIVGMAKALELACYKLDSDKYHIINLKSHFVDRLKSEIPNIEFNANSDSIETNTYTLVNLRLPMEASKSALLLFQLDLKGIACSKGSACQSGSDKGSHVLAEILNDEERSKPSIRFSFSIYNTLEEVDFVVNTLKEFCIN